MPYRICKSIRVESGHMLTKHTGKCKYPHGHSRQVEIVLEADELDSKDMVCDFKAVTTALGDFLSGFDHAMCVNTHDPMYKDLKSTYGDRVLGFDGVDPTTEVVAKFIYDKVAEALRSCVDSDSALVIQSAVRLVKVRVWETTATWAEYWK